MTFHFLFFTVTIKRRVRSEQEQLHDVYVQKRFEEVKERQASIHRLF